MYGDPIEEQSLKMSSDFSNITLSFQTKYLFLKNIQLLCEEIDIYIFIPNK